MGGKNASMLFLVEVSQEYRIQYWACNLECNLDILPPAILQSEGVGQIILDRQLFGSTHCILAGGGCRNTIPSAADLTLCTV